LTAHVHDEFAPKLTDQFHVYGVTRRGIGKSDKPTTGYSVQRSANDVLEVLDSLNLQRSLLVGTSCAGQILTLFASQHSDRLRGLVYIDGATDPTTSASDPPMPDPTTLPGPITPPRLTSPHSRPFGIPGNAIKGSAFPKLSCVNRTPRTPTVRWADR
jgi:pimeloyl-ACP methyl ester carboxylesterase